MEILARPVSFMTGPVEAEVRLYNPLFLSPAPSGGEGFAADLNPQSLEVITNARLEPAAATGNTPGAVQFERLGYFCPDKDSAPGKPVFNRTVGLRDSYAKIADK